GLAFRPSGTRLATVGADGTLRLWDTDAGVELLTLLQQADPLFDVAFSRDGRKLACRSRTGLHVWDSDPTPEPRPPRRFPAAPVSLATGSDGVLAVGTADGRVHCWDPVSDRVRFSFPAHRGEVTALEFNRGGKRLASVGQDGRVRLWDGQTGRL